MEERRRVGGHLYCMQIHRATPGEFCLLHFVPWRSLQSPPLLKGSLTARAGFVKVHFVITRARAPKKTIETRIRLEMPPVKSVGGKKCPRRVCTQPNKALKYITTSPKPYATADERCAGAVNRCSLNPL